MFVESAPGRLKDTYVFGDEEDRIRAAVGATGPSEDDMLIKKTPQISELREEVKKDKWDAIHVTGIDAHQAGWFVKGFYDVFPKEKSAIWGDISTASGRLLDGMVLREAGESERPVRYDGPNGLADSGEFKEATIRRYPECVLFGSAHGPRTGRQGRPCRSWISRRD